MSAGTGGAVVDVRVAGTTADVTIRADVDFRYASSSQVDSGIYTVLHRFKMVLTGDDWRIVSIDSDDDFQRFKKEVMSLTGKGRSVRQAADIARRERIADLPRLKDQLHAIESQSRAVEEAGSFGVLSVEPTAAASYSYSGSNGSGYAQRFAPAGTPRWFYYVNGGDCTNFVSQCVWAAYGGYVSSSDTTSKNNITNKVRMVPNVWHGGTGGGMTNWESVTSFWTYTTGSTKTRGPMATGYNNGAKYTGINPADVRVGNVLQVRNGSSGNYGHSVYVSLLAAGPPAPGQTWWTSPTSVSTRRTGRTDWRAISSRAGAGPTATCAGWSSELGLSISRSGENQVSSMRLMGLPIVTAVLAATLAGCAPATQRTGGAAGENGSSQSTEITAVVSQREFASAKSVLMRHLEALSAGDTQVLLETSPEYRHHIFTQPSWPEQARSWAELKVVSVETPGKYLGDEAMRQVCREALGRLPYQVAVFHVVVARPSAPRNGQETDLDVVLIRPSADSGWLVHDMGR